MQINIILAFLSERRQRTSFSKYQINELEREFVVQPYPGYEKKYKICDRLELSEPQVRIWFKNRRKKQRKGEISKQLTPQQREMLNWIA